MKIKACDALCGCGKTSACINMMNEQKDKRFIFVTQYLDEVDRILDKCKSRGFVAPLTDDETHRTKLEDIRSLIKAGKNIATTHSLFLSYTSDIKNIIKEQHYTLILDETVDVLCSADIAKCDIDILKETKMIEEDGDYVRWIKDDYSSEPNAKFRNEMLRARSKNFLKIDDQYFFWIITPELFQSFDEVYVLTYLFEFQYLKYFFDMYEMKYELIGVTRKNNKYTFCPMEEMDRRRDLRDKIHILEKDKLNAIGNERYALSLSWYLRGRNEGNKIQELQKNIANVFKNIFEAPANQCLWTTFKAFRDELKGKGYAGGFIPYNLRASNKYANKRYLAYCMNNFPRPWERKCYFEKGIQIDGDMYALSILIQWVFRSAIRNDKEIWVYIPSERMRFLFKRWIDNLAKGKDLEPICYSKKRRMRKNKIKKAEKEND